MLKRRLNGFALLLILTSALAAAQDKPSPKGYRTPDEVASSLRSFVAKHPQAAKLVSVGKSTSGRDISVLRLALPGKSNLDPDARPAVFVAANLEGVHLPGTEAALALADALLAKSASDKKIQTLLETRTVYIAPLLNPDGAGLYFAPLRCERWTNARPADDDADGVPDEDGPDDLNKDGLITQMRVKDPEGKYIADPKEPRLMRPADPKKGEKGIYALYAEGLDNDGDGEYNEDPSGGVELNRNFPHDFEYNVKNAGLWPVSEAETHSLLKFLLGRPNIALILNFSTENTILNQQQTGQARLASEKIRVPRQFAAFLGFDPETEYTMSEIVETLKSSGFARGMEIDEGMVAMFLGLGPAVTIDRLDQAVLEAVQKEYKDGLKAAKIDFLEKRAKGVGKGSFAAYCYYQYGVPVFSVDLWAVPEPKKEEKKDAGLSPDKLKTMSSDEFLALGEEKIAAFLKDQGAPPNFNAGMLINMVKSGQVTPARMAEMMERMPKRPVSDGEEHPDAYLLNWSDTALKGKGFVAWAPFKHPTLGEVEVGGFAPYVKLVPPIEELAKTLPFHTDFFLNLMTKLPDIEVLETKIKALSPDLFQVTVFVANSGWLPTSTAQGRRALASWPIRATVKTSPGCSLFSGRPVETIPFLNGSGDTRKLEWTVKGRKGGQVTVTFSSPKLGTVKTTVVL